MKQKLWKNIKKLWLDTIPFFFLKMQALEKRNNISEMSFETNAQTSKNNFNPLFFLYHEMGDY